MKDAFRSAAVGLVLLRVGSIASRSAWMVPSGPAFAIHADSPGASVPRVRAR